MVKKTKKKIIVAWALLSIISGIVLFFFLTGEKLPQFLSETRKVDANLLIVEGWLPDSAIKMAYNEFKNNNYDLIITTGLKYHDIDFCMVASNGFLIFYPELDTITNNRLRNHKIEVLAHSKMGGDYCSHFNFYVNDSLIADFYADELERKYMITWEGSLTEIDSLVIHFDNDMVDDYGDRNLYIKEIIIDDEIIIPYQFNSECDIGQLDGKERIINDFESHAEIARNKLVTFGLDSASVVAVPGKRVKMNRTLTSALAFKDWLKTSPIEVKAINIISLGMHSRRTSMTFNKILGKSYNIGIISLPDNSGSVNKSSDRFGVLGEFLRLVYYRIILIPFDLLNWSMFKGMF